MTTPRPSITPEQRQHVLTMALYQCQMKWPGCSKRAHTVVFHPDRRLTVIACCRPCEVRVKRRERVLAERVKLAQRPR